MMSLISIKKTPLKKNSKKFMTEHNLNKSGEELANIAIEKYDLDELLHYTQ